MSILDDINNLEKLSNIHDLKNHYNLNNLYEMYKKLVDLEICQDHYFKKYIHHNNLEVGRLEKFWEMRSNMTKLHEMLVKAIATLEKLEILNQTSNLTSQLEKTIIQIENPKNVPNIHSSSNFSFDNDNLLEEQFSI